MAAIIIVRPEGCMIHWEGSKIVASNYPLLGGAEGDDAKPQGEHS